MYKRQVQRCYGVPVLGFYSGLRKNGTVTLPFVDRIITVCPSDKEYLFAVLYVVARVNFRAVYIGSKRAVPLFCERDLSLIEGNVRFYIDGLSSYRVRVRRFGTNCASVELPIF